MANTSEEISFIPLTTTGRALRMRASRIDRRIILSLNNGCDFDVWCNTKLQQQKVITAMTDVLTGQKRSATVTCGYGTKFNIHTEGSCYIISSGRNQKHVMQFNCANKLALEFAAAHAKLYATV